MQSNFYFQPSHISDDIWEQYSDEEKITLSDVCRGFFLIKGTHKIKMFYEMADGMTWIKFKNHGIRIDSTLQAIQESLLIENDVIFVK